MPDAASDLDLEVFTRGEVPIEVRRAAIVVTGGATRAELGNAWWGLADEWIAADSGIHVDLTFFDAAWMEDRLAAVLERHEPSLGYTTCLWHTIRSCATLADRDGWLAAQKARAAVPYPDPLRRRIVEHNHPVLRAALPAYANQLASAVARHDLVSINHRLAGLLASYTTDILFALNRQPHPGEKRQVEALVRRCPLLRAHGGRPRRAAAHGHDRPARTGRPTGPAAGPLDDLLRAEGFDLGPVSR